jgi:O-methyltransferase involved in polyketide biosynthesis
MADKTKWAALVAGAGCPMDAPRPASNKERLLARLQAKPSCDCRVVQQDLSQSWASALVDAGFDRKRKAAG